MEAKPARTPEEIVNRQRKAIYLRADRQEIRLIRVFEKIRDQKPEVFARLICEGVLGIPFEDSESVIFQVHSDKNSTGEKSGVQRMFRYLAELILKRLDEKKSNPDISYVSLGKR